MCGERRVRFSLGVCLFSSLAIELQESRMTEGKGREVVS